MPLSFPIQTALLIVLSQFFACSKAAEQSVPSIQLRDQLGRNVGLTQAARRIASLSPAATESLFAVGCGNRIVLRDHWSDYPATTKEIPSINGMSPSAELIVAARPDLVVVHYPTPTLQAALHGSGIAWIALAPATLGDVAASLELLGLACGQQAAGQREANRLRTGQLAVQAAVAGAQRPKVFYEMDAGDGNRPFTVGRGSFGHALLEAAGGQNAFGDRTEPWLQVGLESILAADPQVWLLADADSAEQPQSAELLRARPGFSQVRAIRDGRIASVANTLLARPGPRLLQGLAELAAAIHPERQAAIETAARSAVKPGESR
jgi:iron complex transport system substrate-binding protein